MTLSLKLYLSHSNDHLSHHTQYRWTVQASFYMCPLTELEDRQLVSDLSTQVHLAGSLGLGWARAVVQFFTAPFTAVHPYWAPH